jgi:hypothetical protein
MLIAPQDQREGALAVIRHLFQVATGVVGRSALEYRLDTGRLTGEGGKHSTNRISAPDSRREALPNTGTPLRICAVSVERVA